MNQPQRGQGNDPANVNNDPESTRGASERPGQRSLDEAPDDPGQAPESGEKPEVRPGDGSKG